MTNILGRGCIRRSGPGDGGIPPSRLSPHCSARAAVPSRSRPRGRKAPVPAPMRWVVYFDSDFGNGKIQPRSVMRFVVLCRRRGRPFFVRFCLNLGSRRLNLVSFCGGLLTTHAGFCRHPLKSAQARRLCRLRGLLPRSWLRRANGRQVPLLRAGRRHRSLQEHDSLSRV